MPYMWQVTFRLKAWASCVKKSILSTKKHGFTKLKREIIERLILHNKHDPRLQIIPKLTWRPLRGVSYMYNILYYLGNHPSVNIGVYLSSKLSFSLPLIKNFFPVQSFVIKSKLIHIHYLYLQYGTLSIENIKFNFIKWSIFSLSG